MSQRAMPRFAAGVVGSLPRPPFVRDLFDPPEGVAMTPAEREKRLDAAVAYAVAQQEQAGLDLVSDGEWRRRSYIGVIAELAHGFELGWVDGRSWHTVVAPMAPKNPGFVAAEGRFLRAHTDRLTKVCLPSPYLLGQRMWDPEKSAAAYPTREAFMRALVPILRRELELLRDSGVDVVQFDDPHICLFVDPRVRAEHADPEREVAMAVDMLNEIVAGVEGVTIGIHLCRRNRGRAGWWGEGGYEPIMPQLRRLEVDQYAMEFTIPVAGDLSALRGLPEDRLIGLGCVDCRGEQVDTPAEIVARVEQALRHVDAARLSLNPDCGFAPGSAADIPLDEAYAKLKNEAAAARILRERYA
jgi:5-methyltetrahydropteroyltriglutamate--homocysteine methyltransferase